jgi:hypothetical protein
MDGSTVGGIGGARLQIPADQPDDAAATRVLCAATSEAGVAALVDLLPPCDAASHPGRLWVGDCGHGLGPMAGTATG